VRACDVRVVLARGTAESFEGYDEEEDADAGAGEHAVTSDVPAAGEEACDAVSFVGLSMGLWRIHLQASMVFQFQSICQGQPC